MADNKRFYIEGSTVREINPEQERRERIDRRQREEERKRRVRRNAAKRNRERAFTMSRPYVAFLSICVIISAVAAGYYVKLQTEIAKEMSEIATLETNITNLRANNDARYKSVSTSVDLEYVKDVAINQLGMKYASEDQIVYYSIENSNFMNQYNDIPQ